MRAMQARAVDAVREWNARIDEEHGADAAYLMCSHGDIIKSLVADALGMHLDLFQRLHVDPCSVTVIRYTPTRPFLLRLGDTGEFGGLGARPAAQSGAASADKAAEDAGNAVVGGGAGAV